MINIRYYFSKKLVQSNFYIKFALSFEILAYGVTGNTFVFGAKEYRFETYWANINLKNPYFLQ